MNIKEEKLKKFQKICLEMSDNDKKKLKKELDAKAESKIKKELDIFNQKLETRFEKEKIRLEKDYNKKIIDLQLNSKKQLLTEEEKEKHQLFEECINKLTEYTSTDEYIYLLKQILKNTLNYLGNNKNLTIYLTNMDSKKVDFNRYGSIEVLEDKYIGGLKFKNNDMIVDNTFLTSLKEKIYGTKENS